MNKIISTVGAVDKVFLTANAKECAKHAKQIIDGKLPACRQAGLRTRMNIEWPNPVFCYAASVVNCSVDMKNNLITFYAYEWVNKRYGKVIREVNLYGSSNFQTTRYWYGMNVLFDPLPSNAIILAGISKVLKREPFVPKSK
jgi:hypothetical protein